MMDIKVKRTVKSGNSCAVILPRSWINREVRIELIKKSDETILFETLNILKEHISLDKVIGVYLTGSYARGDEDVDSDIDVLVLTDGIDKEVIREGAYSILLMSDNLLRDKLKKDLLPIGQMIVESKPLINADYLKNINVKVTRENVEWYIKTTKDKLILIKKIIEKNKEVDGRVAYTLVLRIRTLMIIEELIKNKRYSKKDFLDILSGISPGLGAYQSYIGVKNNLNKAGNISLDEAKRLYNYLEKKFTIGTEIVFRALKEGAKFIEVEVTSQKRSDTSRFAGRIKGNLLELRALYNILSI